MNGEKCTSIAEHPNAAMLQNVAKGFDHLFSDDIASAKKHFQPHDDPLHLLGLGVCTFLEAALGMESGLMTEASRCLTLAEAGARKQLKVPKPSNSYRSRFQFGLEWEVIHADTVVLLGLTHALNESYMGYLQCMYALKTSHSKFTKLFKIVYPNGLPSVSNALDYTPNIPQKFKSSSDSPIQFSPSLPASAANSMPVLNRSAPASTFMGNNLFSRWVGVSVSTPVLPLEMAPDGPVEDLIESGTAFGFGLFNLIFSLLPKKVQGVVGFFGFQHDRSRALEALAVSSAKMDLHGVFASLVLMTYTNSILAFSGYQADEQRLLKQVEEMVSRLEEKYPSGTLWILNRAKIERMSYNTESAIRLLQGRLEEDKPRLFAQADIVMYFELAWVLLSQRKYLEAVEAFTKVMTLNSWSHGTYYFLIAGCHLAGGDIRRAKTLLDKIPAALEKKKAGRELPIEVYIKKKLAFYKDKQHRRGNDLDNWIEVVKINPAEELGIFWNVHPRVKASVAQERINDLMALTPHVSIPELPSNLLNHNRDEISGSSSKTSSSAQIAGPASSSVDLDSPDELAIRALLLGINYRTQAAYETARGFLAEAQKYKVTTSTWVPGFAMFEMAVLDLKETEARTIGIVGDERKTAWTDTLNGSSNKLDCALSLLGSSVDLSSRLESRIAMLRDEIAAKAVMEGIVL